jgi:hypothetical protein
MKVRNVLGSFAFAVLAGGCVVSGSARVHPVAVVEVESEPPPPRYEEVVVRPGFVYIQGRWNWEGGRWVWMGGRYERERVGYMYAPGRWEMRGNRHIWVEGEWRAGAAPARVEAHGAVEVRDHRTPAPAPQPAGPVVRDHRHD